MARRISRRELGLSATAAALGALAGYSIPRLRLGQEPAQRPNVVVLLADDMRWDMLGASGNRQAITPNLDRLAGSSVFFENAFVTTSLCGPSRASIMLGQYASRHKIWNLKDELSKSQFESTYHHLLREAGYVTGFIGKWGIGQTTPNHGFDFFDGYPNEGKYFDPARGPKHLTRQNAESAVAFVKQQKPNKPWALTVSFWAPHAQSDEPENENPIDPEQAQNYDVAPFVLPPTFSNNFAPSLPPGLREKWAETLFERRYATFEKFQKFTKGYYQLVTGMDEAIGKILASLDENGFLNNTLIIFTSDNGYFLGEHGLVGKWLMYEESIRIPLVIHFPKTQDEGSSNRYSELGVRSDIALNIDIAPTILSTTSVRPSTDSQGQSLRGAPNAREDFFYEYKLQPFKCIGVRTTRWKYMFFPVENYELLFDLLNDPYEQRDLAHETSYQPMVDQLRGKVISRYANTELG